MREKERFAEIVKTVTDCATAIQKLEKELYENEGIKLNLSELFYALGYIKGMCGREGEE